MPQTQSMYRTSAEPTASQDENGRICRNILRSSLPLKMQFGPLTPFQVRSRSSPKNLESEEARARDCRLCERGNWYSQNGNYTQVRTAQITCSL